MTVGSLAGATVLYDADCGWCRWTLAKFLRWDLHDRLPTLTIQSPVGGAMLAAMPVEEHLASWHLVTPHGHVYAGERTRARLTASSTSSARSFRRPGIWEVVDAASTKPCGFMRFEPGPRMGGHCLPVDQFYLSWRARV